MMHRVLRLKYVNQMFKKIKQRNKLSDLIANGFPLVIVPAIRYLIDNKIDEPEIASLIEKIENIRYEVAAGGEIPVEILYSPQPGSSGNNISLELRPSPGNTLRFTMKQVAQTGKDRTWGTFLHLCARSAQSKYILELGSCVGISGCYLSSSPYCEKLLTVEGSPQLAEIAKNNLNKISNKATVYSELFDDALDGILPHLPQIDFAFIDGHHEKVATVHYFERLSANLSPHALVVFDDISWSYDMRECWKYLANYRGFTDVIDIGALGICVWDPSATSPIKYWDLQKILGRYAIGDPHGWKS